MLKFQILEEYVEKLTKSPVLKSLVRTVKQHWQEEYQNKVSEAEKQPSIPSAPLQSLNSPLWFDGLQEQADYLKTVQQSSAIQEILNLKQETEGQTLLAFICCSAQWPNIIQLWEHYAEKCKATHQAATDAELGILENAIALYNLSLKNSKAQLLTPQIGENYDYTLHYQVSGSGDLIQDVLLPALYSASGEKIKSALILTTEEYDR